VPPTSVRRVGTSLHDHAPLASTVVGNRPVALVVPPPHLVAREEQVALAQGPRGEGSAESGEVVWIVGNGDGTGRRHVEAVGEPPSEPIGPRHRRALGLVGEQPGEQAVTVGLAVGREHRQACGLGEGVQHRGHGYPGRTGVVEVDHSTARPPEVP